CDALYTTERKLMLVCIDMENTGVKVDITRARELKAEAESVIKQIQSELNDLVAPLTVTRKKRGQLVEEVREVFNANSSATELPAAFEKLGFVLKYKTKPKKGKKGKKPSGGGRWAFDEYAMIRYVSQPIATII